MPQDLNLPAALRLLLSELNAVLSVRRVEAYATGGFLRDALLGITISDLDISVRADPLDLGPQLAGTFNGHYFSLDEERRLVRVLLPAHDLQLDLMPIEGSIEDDLMTRDYTIDAMAAPLNQVAVGSVVLIDPAGGLPDLLDRSVRLLDELGLLDRVLPELAVTRAVEQPKEHHWDVFGHSLAALEALDALFDENEPAADRVKPLWQELWSQLEWWDDARGYLSREYVANTHRCSLIKLAGLLHDIGKPETKSFEDSGRMRFLGHHHVGADIAARLMRRLRFSSRETDLVRAMIDAHLRPLQMAQQGAPSRKAIYRFFRDTGEAGIDTLFLSLADHLGTVGPRVDLEGWRQHVSLVSYILRKRLEEAEIVAPSKLVDGDDLMAALGVAAGPLLGGLLEVVREAQASGEVSTQEQAIALARRRLEQTKTPAS